MVIMVRSAQDRVVDGGRRPVRTLCCTVHILLALTTQDLFECDAHLLVPVGVYDRVHGRVEFR